jgi:hypothetical protein
MPARASRDILERMFGDWESGHAYPTLFRVDRDVVVSTAEALPTTGRKLAGQPPIWVRSFGLQIEPRMSGRQIARVRRSNGGWLAVVLVPAASGNGRSSLTIPLWLDPSMESTDGQEREGISSH